ncbi:pentatricopeptide repeat-containing protein At4g04790, mitochondrial-like isoform X2 [Durio zibethinus]|uniref:Pentatricopeptide repeat-containing protein At4g04790, mitochondrial-like isoform X2 n=1 Tax=Durio zibethinus TaxID=66656 RepID=A0A6P5Y0S9_DURZI|nr:pentatricopeptide repeat-containing protein At4g04790, mitochondrial-like isoform X2 [Durio zibethinus]
MVYQMTGSKGKTLSSLFKTAVKKATKRSSLTAGDKALIQFVSSLDTSSPSPSFTSLTKIAPEPTKKPAPDGSLSSQLLEPASTSENSMEKWTEEISTILCVGALDSSQDSEEMTNDRSSLGGVLDLPWLSNLSNNNISVGQKEVSHERKQKWAFKKSQANYFNKLIKTCGDKLGTKATMEVFDKLGRETGVTEYNALIAVCLEKARTSDDEKVAFEHISEAFRTFKKMREQGFQLEEGTYGPLLMYFIDMGMVEEFFCFCEPIKDGNLSSHSRLGYYEMLLWVGVNNEEKIQELCNYIVSGDWEDDFKLKENYLLALCESGRKEDLMQLLEIIDLTRISSVDQVANVFQSLGKLSLESFAEKFLLAFKNSDCKMDDISRLVFSYASGIPNLAVEDLFLKFKSLHMKFKITPSSASYEKLITHCCDLHEVHLALDIVEQMCEAGLSFSIETLHSILHASKESYEFNLVWRIYSLICRHNLKPNSQTFRSMISLCVKMKDFEGAYAMLNDLKKFNMTPTASIYNTIMAGYFQKKNVTCALMVLEQMERDDVKPDSQTFRYLIGNCDCEEDITKYCEEMKRTGIQATKHIFMALINAYTTCGQFEKAKQVLLDKGIPVQSLNEIKSELVSALATSGRVPDALNIYKEIKQNGGSLEPKAVVYLIEHFPSDGELSVLLPLLEELHDPDYWVDGCCKMVLHCVRNHHLRAAVDLLKQLKDKFQNDDLALEVILDEVFSLTAEVEPKDLQIGLSLLQAIKDELGLTPSRKCLDFLLNACVNAKDLQNSLLIWNEYQAAGYPYNILTFLRGCARDGQFSFRIGISFFFFWYKGDHCLRIEEGISDALILRDVSRPFGCRRSQVCKEYAN